MQIKFYKIKSIATILLIPLFIGCTSRVNDYPIQPVPFTSVKVNDKFWAPRIKKNHEVTIPIAFKQCELTGRIKNFKIAGKVETGSFCSLYPFDDSDVYKIIEGASFSLQTFPDKVLENYLDSLIHYIALAQEPDGYLYTNRTIDSTHMHEWVGKKRWEKDPELSHELYNIGHMYEAAVAHYQATGKRTLLDVAIKSANLVYNDFIGKKLPYYPGHQVIEMGLVKLFRVTGEKKYLELAKYMLDIRHDGEEYNQAHIPVLQQDKIVGHAVRATYMYSGMADVAAVMNNPDYSKPLFKIWNDLISTKYYITGGIGSSGSNEGFGEPYDLPNMNAYCETCASIGLVFWNYRMFLLTGESKYYDVLERTLYNALLSGVSLSGDHFFYPNVLESRGQHERSEWFGCACCPGNICRFLPSLPGYMYALKGKELYANLYINSSASIKINNINTIIEQVTDYPWNGRITLKVDPDKSNSFVIKLRVPSWINNKAVPSDLYYIINKSADIIDVKINGTKEKLQVKDGYISIYRTWSKGDIIDLEFPLKPKIIKANPMVKADYKKIAMQRGPLVYCLEWPEHEGKVLNLLVDSTKQIISEFKNDLLNGVEVLRGTAKQSSYLNDTVIQTKEVEFTAIPYYAWANRGAGEMSVWHATSPEVSKPSPPPTIASTSEIKASTYKKSIVAIVDFELPDSSNDHSIMYYHWWPLKDKSEWIEYSFKKSETISESSVYWFDDGPWGGCRIPKSYRILYKSGSKWLPVNAIEPLEVVKNKLNTVHFEKVKTSAIRLEVTFQKDWSSGLYEWIIK